MINLKNVDMMALMPCPLKVPFEKAVEQFLEKFDGRLSVRIEANANNHMILEEKLYEKMAGVEEISELPGIIISPGINQFFWKKFRERFVVPGCFEDRLEERRPLFIDTEYLDPDKHYTMFTMNLLVIVADTRYLDGQEVPGMWEDLLHEGYRDKLMIRGRNNTFCETVLLNFYSDYGMEGIGRLAENVKCGGHPSEMIKRIQSPNPEGIALYSMPYFFARTLEKRKEIRIIWPEEGALVNAISMLVKKGSSPEVQALADFVLSREMGEVFENAGFPSAHAGVNSRFPEGKRLKWLGWEFLHKEDVGQLMEDMNRVFGEIQEKKKNLI